MPELEIPARLRELLAHPQEDLDCEIKSWLNLKDDLVQQATLTKAIFALANHGGGYVLNGFENAGVPCPPAVPRPPDLSHYEPDVINQFIAKYAEPGLHCKIVHVSVPPAEERHPVIIVPPNPHPVPIVAKRNGPDGSPLRASKVYIRRHGPASEEPQTWREWWDLFQRCQKNARGEVVSPPDPEAEIRKCLADWAAQGRVQFASLCESEPPNEMPHRYEHGVWSAAYGIFGEFAEPSDAAFKEMLWRAQVRHNGMPLWVIRHEYDQAPYAVADGWECWLRTDPYLAPFYSEFWRASLQGLMYCIRGYEEDVSITGQRWGYAPETPGTTFFFTQPLALVGEVMLHAAALAQEFTQTPTVLAFHFRWEGLRGRTLAARGDEHLFRLDIHRKTARISDVETPVLLISSDELRPRLAEWVEMATRPLYRAFNVLDLTVSTINGWLKKKLPGLG